MVETVTGHDRSDGITVDDLLKKDRVPAPATFFEQSPMKPGLTRVATKRFYSCLLYTSPSPRDATLSRMPSSA